MRTRIRKVDASLDRQIITGMIVSDAFLAGVFPIYRPEFLLTPFAVTVAGWCLDYYEKYKKAPEKSIQDIFKSKEREGNLVDSQLDEIEQFLFNLSEEYEKAENSDFDFLLDEARKEFEKRHIKNITEDVEAHISNGDIEDAKKLLESYKPLPKSTTTGKGYTAKELEDMDMPEIRWVVDGVIPEGLTLFAGKPKVGKSFFLLNAAISVAAGTDAFGSIPTEQINVLYLALEDPISRIKDRLSKMRIQPYPEQLTIFPVGEWPRANEGGMEQLEQHMQNNPETRLIIIDTLERFKKPQKSSGYNYSEDAQSLIPLHEFANMHHIAVVVVHHTKKTAASDPFDEMYGTSGLTGAADTLAKLDRTPTGKEGRVYTFRGRDIGEGELSFRFDGCRYTLIEDEAEQYHGSEQRQAIIRYLKRMDAPVPRKDLVETMDSWGVGKGVDTLIKKLARDGEIQKIGYGVYAHRTYEDDSWRVELWQRIHNRLNRKKAASD